jgi:uncharacterized RDD family membrane protein YckC
MQSPHDPRATAVVPAGLARRLGAVVYDSLLLLAVLMIATAAFLPLTGGEALDPARHPTLEFAYRAVLLLLIVGYYGLCWTQRGQTLGMASWRLRIERDDGRALGWGDTTLRLAAAVLSWLPLGLGYLWIAFDPRRRAWHDRLSGTRVLLVPKDAGPR